MGNDIIVSLSFLNSREGALIKLGLAPEYKAEDLPVRTRRPRVLVQAPEPVPVVQTPVFVPVVQTPVFVPVEATLPELPRDLQNPMVVSPVVRLFSLSTGVCTTGTNTGVCTTGTNTGVCTTGTGSGACTRTLGRLVRTGRSSALNSGASPNLRLERLCLYQWCRHPCLYQWRLPSLNYHGICRIPWWFPL
jgi:hypothetical protein